MIQELWSSALPMAELFATTGEVSDAVNGWLRRSSSMTESGLWIFVVLAIVLLWIGLYLWDRSRKPGKQAGIDREGLFAELCDLHNLSKSDRQLLRTVARTQRVDQPALAFINPNLLLKFAESNPGASAEVRHLADRLFGRALVEEIVRQSPAEAAP